MSVSIVAVIGFDDRLATENSYVGGMSAGSDDEVLRLERQELSKRYKVCARFREQDMQTLTDDARQRAQFMPVKRAFIFHTGNFFFKYAVFFYFGNTLHV